VQTATTVAIPDELDLQFGPKILDNIVFIIYYTVLYIKILILSKLII